MTTTFSPTIKKNSASQHLFLQILDKYITDARIKFVGDGIDTVVGSGNSTKDDNYEVLVRVHNQGFFDRVLTYGNLGMGEAYMDRDFEIEKGTLADFITILLRNRLDKKVKQDLVLGVKVLGIQLLNYLRGEKHNVQSHYDLGDDLFESFLDPTMTYSCGYARTPEDDLEQLQINKLDRICQKLRLQPGDKLLDIGCGFGGLLIYAAKNYGITGVGITISQRHCDRGNQIIAEQGLSEKIEIKFQDHRAISGTFDKVVSVGMMEHLPRKEYDRYISNIGRVLTPQGLGLVHAIGCNTNTNKHDPFIQKYIFPGSGQPKLSEISHHLEQNHLAVLDVENIVRHYGYTVEQWLKNFENNQHQLDSTKYDERFMRMWKYYFGCGIAAAFASDSAVYQVLFTKDHTAPIPLQRV